MFRPLPSWKEVSKGDLRHWGCSNRDFAKKLYWCVNISILLGFAYALVCNLFVYPLARESTVTTKWQDWGRMPYMRFCTTLGIISYVGYNTSGFKYATSGGVRCINVDLTPYEPTSHSVASRQVDIGGFIRLDTPCLSVHSSDITVEASEAAPSNEHKTFALRLQPVCYQKCSISFEDHFCHDCGSACSMQLPVFRVEKIKLPVPGYVWSWLSSPTRSTYKFSSMGTWMESNGDRFAPDKTSPEYQGIAGDPPSYQFFSFRVYVDNPVVEETITIGLLWNLKTLLAMLGGAMSFAYGWWRCLFRTNPHKSYSEEETELRVLDPFRDQVRLKNMILKKISSLAAREPGSAEAREPFLS